MNIAVTLPIRAVSVANMREHWAKRASRTKQHRLLAWAELRAVKAHAAFLGRVEVVLTRIAPRPLDGDNLAASMKGVRDGVADWLGVDDRESPYLGWAYKQERGAPKQYAVRIEVRS